MRNQLVYSAYKIDNNDIPLKENSILFLFVKIVGKFIGKIANKNTINKQLQINLYSN